MERRRGDAIFLGEANVSPQEQQRYFAIDDGDGVQMLFDFRTCAAQWLAHARGSAEPLIDALSKRPRIPEQAQFANFCRHHDELNIGMLSDSEREEVFAAFAPEHTHRLYGRGIRRRLAPMLGNDQRRIRLALALTMALPGTRWPSRHAGAMAAWSRCTTCLPNPRRSSCRTTWASGRKQKPNRSARSSATPNPHTAPARRSRSAVTDSAGCGSIESS